MYLYERKQPAPRKIPVRSARNGVADNKSAPRSNTALDPVESSNEDRIAPAANKTDWQERALRLQAEMENFRKRQMRRADEAATAERERLLTVFLPVVDNLARALNHQNENEESLRQGVELIHRELTRLLAAEGVTRLETIGQPLDPEWHEAVATIPAEAAPGVIVEEIEPGYKLGEKLLRPARVVVAA